MKIKNKKNKANYLNFRDGGVPKKILIPAGKTVEVVGLNNLSQVINSGDFTRGFFEAVAEEKKNTPVKAKASKKKSSKKKKKDDTLDKVSKEVKDYTENENEEK